MINSTTVKLRVDRTSRQFHVDFSAFAHDLWHCVCVDSCDYGHIFLFVGGHNSSRYSQ